jgi:hypothetical protein
MAKEINGKTYPDPYYDDYPQHLRPEAPEGWTWKHVVGASGGYFTLRKTEELMAIENTTRKKPCNCGSKK